MVNTFYSEFAPYGTLCGRFTGTSSSSIWQVAWCHCRLQDSSPAHTMSSISTHLEVRSYHSVKVKVKADIALNDTPSQSYGTSLAMWDHTVLSATQHKWTRPTLPQPFRLVLDLPIPRMDGRLSWLTWSRPGRESNQRVRRRTAAPPRQTVVLSCNLYSVLLIFSNLSYFMSFRYVNLSTAS